MKPLAEKLARQAGAELKTRFSGPIQVSHKGEIDLVTDADKAAEALILAGLPKDHAVVAEESGAHGQSEWCWYIDPLDGTSNFAHRVPHFAVSIALYHRDVCEVAVVYDPLRDELFSAERGKGATLNGVAIQVTQTALVKDAMLATGFPYWIHDRPAPVLQLFGDFAKVAQSLRRFGSAALDLAWVACGRFDGFFELGLKPWDIAAGALLVREAGGVITALDGSPMLLRTGDILAANPTLHGPLLAVTLHR